MLVILYGLYREPWTPSDVWEPDQWAACLTTMSKPVLRLRLTFILNEVFRWKWKFVVDGLTTQNEKRIICSFTEWLYSSKDLSLIFKVSLHAHCIITSLFAIVTSQFWNRICWLWRAWDTVCFLPIWPIRVVSAAFTGKTARISLLWQELSSVGRKCKYIFFSYFFTLTCVFNSVLSFAKVWRNK